MYHWPVLQVLAVAGVNRAGHLLFTTLGLVLAVGLATASWYLIERRALRFKDATWLDPTRRSPVRAAAHRR